MALEDRTVDLILKAEIGQALKPVADMVQQVKAFTVALKEQQEAARNGTTTNADYSKSVNGMKDAAGELLKARLALETFSRQQTTVDLRQGRVDLLREARNAAVAAAPDVNQRTATQQTVIDRRERALATAERQAQNVNAQYARTVTLLEHMGVLSDKLAANQQRLAIDAAHATITEANRTAGSALADAREFDVTSVLRRAKAQADAEKEAGVRVAAAIREREAEEEAARNLALRRALGNTRTILAEQERISKELGDARVQAEQENTRRAEAAASVARATAARGVAGAPGVTPVTATGQVNTLLTGLDRASVGVVTDVEAATDKLVVTLGKAGLTAQSFNAAMDQVFATQRRISQDASLIDAFKAQEAAVRDATKADHAAVLELQNVAKAREAGVASANDLRRAEVASVNTANNLAAQIAQQKAIADQLKARKIDTTALDAETNRLIQTTERLANAQRGASAGGSKLFGLDAFQFQNLQFQINDVITQLSLGQGVLRTFEAQGGQIFQIFELTVGQMKQLALYGIPAAVAIGLVFLAFQRVGEVVQAQRGFAGLLAGTVNAAGQSAKVLTDITREAEKTGMAFSDAKDAVTEFAKAGLNPDAIRQIVGTIRDLSLGLGLKPADVTKELAVLTAGTADELRKLLDTYGALTPKLNEYITAQERSGNLDLARQATLDALATRGRQAATEGISPVTAATVELKNAWHDFLEEIGNEESYKNTLQNLASVIRAAKEAVEWISKVLPKSGGPIKPPNEGTPEFNKIVRELNDSAVAKTAKQLKDIQEQLLQLNRTPILPSGPAKNALLLELEDQLLRIQKEYDAAIKKRDEFNARVNNTQPEGTPTSPGATTSGARSAADAAESRLGQNLNQVTPFLGVQNTETIVNAWCAAFANAALRSAGIAGSGSNVATSFEKWGEAVAAAAVQRGDILVQARGHAAGETGGHVGLATGQIKTGANGALLVEMISGNSGGQVRRTFEDASGLDVRRATPGQFIAPAAGIGRTGGNAQTQNDIEQQAIRDRINATVDSTLRGVSAAREAQDKRLADLEETRVKKEMDAIRGAAQENDQSIALRKELDDQFRAKQKAEREKEELEDRKALTLAITTIQKRQDAADKTNAAKMRAVADENSVPGFLALEQAQKRGLTSLDGKPLAQVRSDLEAGRAKDRELATIAADQAIVEAEVKARDDRTAMIAADAKAGVKSLNESFDLLGAAVRESGVKIAAAKAKALADLDAQPQTPKIAAERAKIERVRPQDENAFEAFNAVAMAQINDLIATRTALLKELDDLVKDHRITVAQGEEAAADLYKKTGGEIRKLVEEQQKRLALEKQLGVISPSRFDREASGLRKITTETEKANKFQSDLINTFENSVANRGVQAFEAVADSIGKVIAGTGTWKDVLSSVGIAFANFAAGVLKDVAAMILKFIILQAIQSALGFSTGGASIAAGAATSAVTSAANAAGSAIGKQGHIGGIVGSLETSRPIDLNLFREARRMHAGGMVGLGKDEVPVIVQTGEEILTKSDARHRNNYMPAKADQGADSIRNVILFDPSEVAGAMRGTPGEKVVLTHIRKNAPALRQLLRM